MHADRNTDISVKSAAKGFSIQRDIKHSFDIPSGKKVNTFSISVTDTISFTPENGPFNIEIVVGGVVFLKDKVEPSDLHNVVRDKKNADFLINQCLPYSCASIAYLTDRMGFGPIILSPQFSTQPED